MSRGPDRTHTREAVLDAMRSREDGNEPWTTKEIQDALGCTRTPAYNRLRELVTLGLVGTKKVGAKGRIWWLIENEHDDAEPESDARLEPVESA